MPRPSLYVEGHFPFSHVFLELITGDHCLATSPLVVLNASTFMDQHWSLFSAPSYSFSLYNSFSATWDCGNVSVGWSSSLHTDWRPYLVVLDKWYHQEMIIIQNGYINPFITYGFYHDKNKSPAYHRDPVYLNCEPYCSKISLLPLKRIFLLQKSLGLIYNFLLENTCCTRMHHAAVSLN